MARLLRHERQRRHAGLGIDFEEVQPAGLPLGVVVTEIGARHAAAAQHAMRRKGGIHRLLVRVGMDRRGDQVLSAALGVLGRVVVEALARPQFCDREGPVAQLPVPLGIRYSGLPCPATKILPVFGSTNARG